MKKSELIDELVTSNSSFFAIVGPNNSGKSYFIKNELFDNPKLASVFFIDEKGSYNIKGNKSKVVISDGHYIFRDEKKRGNGVFNENFEKIEESTQKIIDELEKVYSKLDIANKSLGTQKLFNIVDSLLQYDLNNIDYYLFDEPENSLDDERMKYLESIFLILKDNGRKVLFVTHSPRFLELLQIEPDDIYLLHKDVDDIEHYPDEFINFKKNSIYRMFDEVGASIVKYLSDDSKNGITYSNIDYIDFQPGTNLSRLQIDLFLKQFDFYKVLFYGNVCVVEGETEEYIVKSINDKIESCNTIFASRGKYYIPFLICLFYNYKIKVQCVIDSDVEENGDHKIAEALTRFLNDYTKKLTFKCSILNGDVEKFLRIDEIAATKQLTGNYFVNSNNFISSFKRHHKAILAYNEIKADSKKQQKIIESLSKDDSNSNYKYASIYS